MNKKKLFVKWFKEHKTELVIVGVTIMTATYAVLLYKEQMQTYKGLDSFIKIPEIEPMPILNESTNFVVPCCPNNKIVDVSEFVRNLPSGQHPSSQKVVEATERGLELLENQTIVASHQRSYAA